MQKTIVRITLLLIVLADTGMQPNGHARACLHACGVGGREVCGRGEVAGFLPRFFGVRLSDGVAYMILLATRITGLASSAVLGLVLSQ